jgi:hypothetical protein
MMLDRWFPRESSLALITIVVGSLLACGGPWRDRYFDKGVNRYTQEEVAERMGPPHTAKTPALGGDTIWTYRVSIGDKELKPIELSSITDAAQGAAAMLGKAGVDAPKPTLYCYRYTLTFNEQKILTQWKRDECVPGTHERLNADQ